MTQDKLPLHPTSRPKDWPRTGHSFYEIVDGEYWVIWHPARRKSQRYVANENKWSEV